MNTHKTQSEKDQSQPMIRVWRAADVAPQATVKPKRVVYIAPKAQQPSRVTSCQK